MQVDGSDVEYYDSDSGNQNEGEYEYDGENGYDGEYANNQLQNDGELSQDLQIQFTYDDLGQNYDPNIERLENQEVIENPTIEQNQDQNSDQQDNSNNETEEREFIQTVQTENSDEGYIQELPFGLENDQSMDENDDNQKEENNQSNDDDNQYTDNEEFDNNLEDTEGNYSVDETAEQPEIIAYEQNNQNQQEQEFTQTNYQDLTEKQFKEKFLSNQQK